MVNIIIRTKNAYKDFDRKNSTRVARRLARFREREREKEISCHQFAVLSHYQRSPPLQHLTNVKCESFNSTRSTTGSPSFLDYSFFPLSLLANEEESISQTAISSATPITALLVTQIAKASLTDEDNYKARWPLLHSVLPTLALLGNRAWI